VGFKLILLRFAEMSSTKWSKMKWADHDGDDGEEEKDSKSATSTFISPPDKDGIKTITEFREDASGKKIKVVRRVKEVKKITKQNKYVLQRRRWKKFGDVAGVPPGPEDNVTYMTHESITLNLKPRKREEAQDEENDDPLAKLGGKDSIVVCRHCGETGHWTLKCPKRDTIIPKGQTAETVAAKDEGSSGKYVPVHLRGGRAGGDARKEDRDDGTAIRVTNISADTTEDDLRDLFRRFGHTSRIYLAKDRNTHESRGFAFINYTTREAAQKAIDKLDGYGYDNLILRVEFAKPREESAQPSAMSTGAGGKAGAGWTMQGTR